MSASGLLPDDLIDPREKSILDLHLAQGSCRFSGPACCKGRETRRGVGDVDVVTVLKE